MFELDCLTSFSQTTVYSYFSLLSGPYYATQLINFEYFYKY